METTIISIIAIILFIFLIIKVSGKLMKTIITFIFVGFVIYILTGTNVISNFLEMLGFSSGTCIGVNVFFS